MPDAKPGLVAVLDDARPHEAPPGDDGEQLDLLGVRPLPEASPGRGRGRPAGSRNRRTSEWAAYLLQRYASPLEVLMQIATAPADDLSRQLACSRLEALQEKRHAAVALLPYLHQRMPLAVDVTDHRIVQLTIVEGVAEEAGSIADDLVAIVQNQRVDDGQDGAV